MAINKISTPLTDNATAAKINEIIDGLGTVLPSQSGNAGKVLTTNGNSASWATKYALVITDYTV